MKMMQSIADAEEPFGSGRIELASTIQPFHICLLLLLLIPILFLLLHILHLLLILVLLLLLLVLLYSYSSSSPSYLLLFHLQGTPIQLLHTSLPLELFLLLSPPFENLALLHRFLCDPTSQFQSGKNTAECVGC